jgi:hypothetical protein
MRRMCEITVQSRVQAPRAATPKSIIGVIRPATYMDSGSDGNLSSY